MASLNKVQLIGNLGRDPELRHTPNGTAVCTVSLATTNAWNDKSTNDRVEESEWHRVVFFSRLAEVVGEYMKKGRPMYVEGRLQTRKWQDKDGKDQYSTEIVASEMQMLGTKPDDARSEKAPKANGYGQSKPPQREYLYGDSDVPF